MNSRILLVIIISTVISVQLKAQTFEEYKKQKASEMAAFKQKQQEFMDRMQKEFDDYVKQKDQEYAAYLKKQWEQMNVMKGIVPPEKPKPPVLPEYKTDSAREGQWVRMPAIKPSINIKKEAELQIKTPMIQKSEEESYAKGNLTFGFFGVRIVLDYDQQMKFDPPAVINPATISSAWEKLSGSNYSGLIDQLMSYKSSMNLNDWAYYLLVQKFAQTLYPASASGEDLMVWGMMTHSGFKTRIAYANNKVSVLVPSRFTLYSKNFYTAGGLNYYFMRDIGTSIYTYDKDYPDANSLVDFSISNPMNFSKEISQKSIAFSYLDKPYSFNFYFNKSLIDFYKDYPQADLNIYFDAPVSSETKESILENFKPVVDGMSEQEAVSFLLRFVQTAFKYATDQQQFAKEKFFFPEEILFYPYSDCEDRSVFFAYLVKTLLNKKVIGIEYPSHISTAVRFDGEVPGDYVMYKNEKYVIADATFENAPVGMAMPEFRTVEGKIIEIDEMMFNGSVNKSYWELAQKSGGYRGSNMRDIVFDTKDNAYLTGYFEGQAQFGKFMLKSKYDPSKRSVFVAKYDGEGNVVWAKEATGANSCTGLSILYDADDDIYISGSYSGKIEFENGASSLQCMEGLNDVFIAKYTRDGMFKWAMKVGLDTYPQENFLVFLSKCSTDGVNKGTSFYNENESFTNYGLQTGPMGLIYLTGTFQNSAGVAVGSLAMNTNELKSFNVIESLKTESDKLIAARYERTIAGVFSVMNLIKLTGIKISGEDVKKAFDKYNPGFKKMYPEIYENIGKINFMLNSDGIIKLETVDGEAAYIDKLKIASGSTLKIISFENGDAQIEVLSGIEVGKLIVWFDLNYVKLYKLNGNLLFDYDSDHTQKMMNIKADILQ
jgi:hypothetical protein